MNVKQSIDDLAKQIKHISVAMRPTEDINPQPARGIPTLIKPRRARLMVQRTTSQTCFHCGRAGHLARHCQTCQIL